MKAAHKYTKSSLRQVVPPPPVCDFITLWSAHVCRYVCVCVLQISDTVVVKAGGAPVENMCSQATKAWDRVSYIIDEQEVSPNSSMCVVRHELRMSEHYVACHAHTGPTPTQGTVHCRHTLSHTLAKGSVQPSQPNPHRNPLLSPPSRHHHHHHHSPPPHTHTHTPPTPPPPPPRAPQDDGPDALEEVTNNNLLPGGKKLRSDDPNYKSSEQIRCAAACGRCWLAGRAVCASAKQADSSRQCCVLPHASVGSGTASGGLAVLVGVPQL
jgi:hypothetical protein